MIFGILDELALAWVLAKQPLRSPAISGPAPGTRPKKFDIVRAADWVIALVGNGLVRGPTAHVAHAVHAAHAAQAAHVAPAAQATPPAPTAKPPKKEMSP
jgi:hypothetical protein